MSSLNSSFPSDHLRLIRALRGVDHFLRDENALITKAIQLLMGFKNPKLAHCSREADKVANWIAKADGTSPYLTIGWPFSMKPFLDLIVFWILSFVSERFELAYDNLFRTQKKNNNV